MSMKKEFDAMLCDKAAGKDYISQRAKDDNTAYAGWRMYDVEKLTTASLRQQLADSQQALRNVYEVWAGSEGIPKPENAVEGYLLSLVKQMRDAAKDGMKGAMEISMKQAFGATVRDRYDAEIADLRQQLAVAQAEIEQLKDSILRAIVRE